MSSQQQPFRPASGQSGTGNGNGNGQRAPAGGKPAPAGTGRQVFRSVPALVVWWLWLAFAVVNLVDLAIQGRDHFSAVVAAIVVLITGVMYACALRPRVVADDTGISLLNPLRDHHVPWAAVTGVDLGDTLQVHCARPGGTGEKILYSWAVQSSRRGRARAGMKAQRSAAGLSRRSPSYARLPPEARAVMGKTQAELTVVQLSQRVTAAQAQAQAPGAWTSRWAWWPIAAMVLPAIALVIVNLR